LHFESYTYFTLLNFYKEKPRTKVHKTLGFKVLRVYMNIDY